MNISILLDICDRVQSINNSFKLPENSIYCENIDLDKASVVLPSLAFMKNKTTVFYEEYTLEDKVSIALREYRLSYQQWNKIYDYFKAKDRLVVGYFLLSNISGVLATTYIESDLTELDEYISSSKEDGGYYSDEELDLIRGYNRYGKYSVEDTQPEEKDS